MFNMHLYREQRNIGTAAPHRSDSSPTSGDKLQSGCDLCNVAFDSDTEVQVHRSIAHQKTLRKRFNRRYGCHICLRTFKLRNKLTAHIRRTHLFIQNGTKITHPAYICDICSSLFFNKQMLAFHILHKHTYSKKHMYSKKYAYKQKHTSSKKQSMNCPKCFKWLRHNSMLQHLDFIHTKSIKTCPFCLEYQSTIESYYAHIEASHVLKLECNFCEYITRSEPALNTHLEKAHGRRVTSMDGVPAIEAFFKPHLDVEKPYVLRPQFMDRGIKLYNMTVCVLCQETCTKMPEMVSHLVKVHGHNMIETPPDVKTLKMKACDCGATFKTEVMLRHHIFKEHEMGHAVISDSRT